MKKVPAPCKVAKNIIAEPSQTWYLTEASNWTPRNLNIDIPRSTGRRSKARQASDNKPQRVAILKNLYCHLKSGRYCWKIASYTFSFLQIESMEVVENPTAIDEGQHSNFPATSSPEIVEIGEESKSTAAAAGRASDVYVAVGKHDLHVLKWALDHVVSPESRVFLVHVFSPIAYIPTPVGRLSRSQLSKDQLQVYIREESNKRRHLLDKYIQLCNKSKISVDTMLVESNNGSAKAILELIAVANVTHLVMGTKQSPFARLSMKGLGKGEYVKKYAPEYCEVSVVYDGKKMKDQQPQNGEGSKSNATSSSTASNQRPQVAKNSQSHFFECVCFSAKID